MDTDFSIEAELYDSSEKKAEEIGKQIQKIEDQLYIMGKTLSEEDRKALYSEIDKYMIEVTTDRNGGLVTNPTKFQKDLAIDRIKNEIEINLGRLESGRPQRKESTGGSGSAGTPLQRETNKLIAEYSNNAFNATGDYNAKFGGLNKNYFYKRNAEGNVEVYKKEKLLGGTYTNAEMVNQIKNLDPIFTATTPSQMADYAKTEASSAAKFKLGGGELESGGQTTAELD